MLKSAINSTFDPPFFHYPDMSLNYSERDLRRSTPLKKKKKINLYARPVVISNNVWRIFLADLQESGKREMILTLSKKKKKPSLLPRETSPHAGFDNS